MDIDQLAKTTDWLDKERQKDQKRITELTERINALAGENNALTQRLKDMEGDLTKALTLAGRVGLVDNLVSQARIDVSKQIESLELRRAESEREMERLRQVEREGVNRSLADMKKSLNAISRLDQDMIARKEEERRINKVLLDIQPKLEDISQRDEERSRGMSAIEETRRQDARRTMDAQTELSELRKSSDEHKVKFEVLEDLVRRNDARLGEMLALENDRRMTQGAWMESQALTGAERDRAWGELKQRADELLRQFDEFSRRMELYGETHRKMKQTLDDYHTNAERIDRRIGEAAEIQRLNDDRFKQEWNAFLADEQKRWTTHMLLRDEQWRDHDRQAGKLMDRVTAMEAQIADATGAVRNLQAIDQSRLQVLFQLIREGLAEYDQTMTKVR
ncbi:MAG: hypothetical protein HY782_22085 [Chloroflexi bacterium]|nr:hypothetical protein [Chloroflexota bacterium]